MMYDGLLTFWYYLHVVLEKFPLGLGKGLYIREKAKSSVSVTKSK
jgi:hypothetical protein